MIELPQQKRPIPTFMTQAEYDGYLDSLKSEGARCISIAGTFAVNTAVVFGVSDKERATFPADKIPLLEYLHECYQAGALKPTGESAFFVQLAEHYAGGKPRPEDRVRVLSLCAQHVVSMLANKNPMNAGHTKDAKRRKFLDDLDALQGEVKS